MVYLNELPGITYGKEYYTGVSMTQHNHPYLQAALLCEEVTTDGAGRHDIHNEFTQYTMGYSQPFTVLTIWRGQSGEEQYQERTEIISPDGRVVASGDNGPFRLMDVTYRQVNSLLLENVDFTHDGIYELRIQLADKHSDIVSRYTYPISVI